MRDRMHERCQTAQRLKLNKLESLACQAGHDFEWADITSIDAADEKETELREMIIKRKEYFRLEKEKKAEKLKQMRDQVAGRAACLIGGGVVPMQVQLAATPLPFYPYWYHPVAVVIPDHQVSYQGSNTQSADNTDKGLQG